MAPNGDVYIAWHAYCTGATGNTGVVNIVRSGNGGADLTNGSVNQLTQAFMPGQANMTANSQSDACQRVPGSQSLWWGSYQPFVLPDPARPNNIYVVAADDPDNNLCNNATPNDPADVVFARSTDNGNTWSGALSAMRPAELVRMLREPFRPFRLDLSTRMATSLVIDTPYGGGTPQRPTLDLVNTSDTGRSDMDNVTRLSTLDFRVSAEVNMISSPTIPALGEQQLGGGATVSANIT